MTNYFYVLSDLDNTIARDDLTISYQTIKSIRKYQKASNYKFSFCTGRVDTCNKKLAKQLKVKLPIIACNGALITDLKTNQVLHAEYLESQSTADLVKMCYQHQIDIVCYAPNMMIGTANSKRLEKWQNYLNKLKKKYHWKILRFDSLLEVAEKIRTKELQVVELIVNFANLNQTEIQQKLKLFDNYLDKIDLVQSLPFLFNIMKKNVNKLTGLKKWVELCQIDYQKVIVFGDNHNDLEIVQAVEKGYAVGNAVEQLKRVAYRVCGSVEENGVGIELEEILRQSN
ncbi:Cof-type HAD-IIB family hydrolase [Mycoplasma putrefaciens]|uniref:HAD-superfamily hydrolase n=1 Tax=Mycoplasma putrefaciens (strain ATCC 15718 / NCTC 10155 / C30 KS-1 / KS-1) TaxID=743965 RepID=A0A7U3ZSE7_MYCPK|nr:Cof-type HAD-IIB family hydrolase [Mycoplasma putrefaciens]AEM68677.1 HAD-superfamily hydrolase [Mycoplasma putrefaciens KS1]